MGLNISYLINKLLGVQIKGTDVTIPTQIKGSDVNLPVQLTGSNAKEPFSGSTTVTHTFTQPMRGFVISNDGASDLTFTIGGDTFIVKSGEIFDDFFDEFTGVTISTAVAFRAFGRG